MDITMKNIAGIVEGSAEIEPGINTVKASNWQGKSSFIRAIETAFGTKKTLTEGKDEGWVNIGMDGEQYEVHLERRGQSVVRHGTPVLEDEYDRTLADLFAFLGEDNEVRRAVRNRDSLREVLTRPLEMEDIDARIGELNRERERVRTELNEAKRRANSLASLEQRRNELESEIERLRGEEREFENAMSSEKREELNELRAERNRVTDLIERLENTLNRSQEKLSEVYEEYENVEVPDASEIESELAAVREEYERAKEDKELLQSVYSANKRILEQDRLDLLSDVERGLAGDSYTCWLCGGETTADEMEAQLDAVGEKVLELREEVAEYDARLSELEATRDEIQTKRRRQSDLDDRIGELESTISERENNLSSARERLETLDEQIEALEGEVDDEDRELADVQSERKYKEAELEDLETEIEAAEAAVEEVEKLEAQEENLESEIQDLRTRKDEMQSRIRSAFDSSIETLVAEFETSFETARLTSQFELVVARNGRQVSLDALSEGEVELLGLVTAVAGFNAYDVAAVTPVILLDQVGALADDNLTLLADYLDDRADSLVLTAYPENTTVGAQQIDPAQWQVMRATEATSS